MGTVQTRTFDFSNEALYNSAYIPLFKNESEFLHLYGSAGSGKSRFAAQKEIVKSFQRQGRKTLVIRKIAKTLKDSVYAELKGVIYDWKLDDVFEMLKSPLHITNTVTGTEFIFIGLDDVEKVKSISGVDRIWIEEATELTSQNELDQLRLRLRGFDKVQITLSYNPIDEHHWINTDIHEAKAPGHDLFHSTYRDNEQLLAKDSNYAKFIESTKDSNPNYYRVYGLGLWGSVVEGLIYPEFKADSVFPVIDGQDDIQFYGLDFGYSDPCALVAQHIADTMPSDKNLQPKKRLITKEVLYETGLDGPNLVQRFNELRVRKDRTIVADSARPEMIKTLRDAGYRVVGSEKFAGSVLSGINNVRKFSIEICAGSRNLLKEIRNYQKNQLTDGTYVEEPAKNQVEHACDAMRYGIEAVSKQWTYKSGIFN
jgi:phage terminase large subunit